MPSPEASRTNGKRGGRPRVTWIDPNGQEVPKAKMKYIFKRITAETALALGYFREYSEPASRANPHYYHE